MPKPRFLNRTTMDVWGDSDWVLCDSLAYWSEITGSTIIVPKGFINDLASIPRLFTRLIPVNGRHRYAAIVHDWLYANANGKTVQGIDREAADKIFLEAMEVLGVAAWKRKAMYQAVRLGGGRYWKRRKGLTSGDITHSRPLSLVNV